MKPWRLFPFFAAALLAAINLSAEPLQVGAQAQKEGSAATRTGGLKLLKAPPPSYPEEALKKNVEGKVILRIVVDAKGRVSDAKALSGPAELLHATLEGVKQWQFEPPANAPVVTTAEVAFGHPRVCPGAVSEGGAVSFSGGLRAERGTLVYLDDAVDQPIPPYPTEERKAGIAGEMILSITVNPKGSVTKVRVVKSLSSNLDNLVTETVRTWRFRVTADAAGSLPDDFPLQILFQPTCDIDF